MKQFTHFIHHLCKVVLTDLIKFLLAGLALIFQFTSLQAQTTYTWTGTTSATWLTSGNWAASPGGAPSGTSAIAYFNNNTNVSTGNGINMNGISVANSSIGAIYF